MTAAPWPYYATLLAGIILGVFGQILLKTGAVRSADGIMQFLDPYTMVGIVVYALAAILYIIAIKRIPLTIAYPSVSLSYFVVAVIAHYVWHEALGPAQIGGMVLISGGILLLHYG